MATLEGLSRDAIKERCETAEKEAARLRELCRDAYAVIDVLAKGVGNITTPDGFFDLWNRTGIDLERVGGKPFKVRIKSLTTAQHGSDQ